MSEMIGTRVSEEIADDITLVAKEEKTDKSKVIRELLAKAVAQKLVDIALEKYTAKEVSLGKAAELAKIPLTDFIGKLFERKINLNYSVDSLEKDFKAAQ